MKALLSMALLACSLLTSGQKHYPVTYQQLKKYEGVYHYINHNKLKIAASPKDTILYAIINQSMYPLRPFAEDVFTNAGNEQIRFIHDTPGNITGYIAGKDTFNLITKAVYFPEKMWYPRIVDNPKNYKYNYTIPAKLKDGLLTGDRTKAGLNSKLLDTMMQLIVAGKYPNVHSILIVKDGRLAFEEYFYEYGRDSLQEQRSASKSVISALTGIAIQKGLIKSVDQKVLPYFPEYRLANNSGLKQQITIKDLLDNQSGLNYDVSDNKAIGNETEMSYTNDWVKYTLDLPMIDTPGTKGRYASGNPITMGRIIEKTSHMPLHDFAQGNLFGPMGITNFKWNFKPDKSNSENYCEVFLRPRDMAKFGLLFLNNGVWKNKQLISAAWVKESTSKQSVVQNVDYGYFWWLKYLDSGGKRFYGIAAQGNGGQKIYIFKEQQLVVVVTGGNYNTQSPSDELIKKFILPAYVNN